eukprot:Rmarinus@m.24244
MRTCHVCDSGRVGLNCQNFPWHVVCKSCIQNVFRRSWYFVLAQKWACPVCSGTCPCRTCLSTSAFRRNKREMARARPQEHIGVRSHPNVSAWGTRACLAASGCSPPCRQMQNATTKQRPASPFRTARGRCPTPLPQQALMSRFSSSPSDVEGTDRNTAGPRTALVLPDARCHIARRSNKIDHRSPPRTPSTGTAHHPAPNPSSVLESIHYPVLISENAHDCSLSPHIRCSSLSSPGSLEFSLSFASYRMQDPNRPSYPYPQAFLRTRLQVAAQTRVCPLEQGISRPLKRVRLLNLSDPQHSRTEDVSENVSENMSEDVSENVS